MLQDGIEFDAYCKGKTKSTFYSAWFEWYPFSEIRIGNLPIAPGEEYFMEVWSTSSTKGHAYLVNVTKKKAVTIVFNAPKGTKLIGNSAEWITERPAVNGGLATLTNYGSQKYSDAHGETFSGKALDPGDSSAIVMVDNKGNIHLVSNAGQFHVLHYERCRICQVSKVREHEKAAPNQTPPFCCPIAAPAAGQRNSNCIGFMNAIGRRIATN